MADKITKAQLEELETAESLDHNEFHAMLAEYTGITAEPYTGYRYFDAAGNYVGNHTDGVNDLLESAYIEVVDNG